MPVRIMHLSDPHLGNDLVIRSIMRKRVWWKDVDAGITAGLINAIQTLNPNFIVISGDLVNKPKKSSYKTAAQYLRNVFHKAHFDMKDHLMVIPGNHDVSFFPKKNPEDLKRLRLYREFLRDLYGEADIDERRHRFKHVDPAAKVIFVCMDSTLKNLTPRAEGEIGDVQRAWLREKVTELQGQLANFEDYIRIAVFHHHCVPIAGTAISSERMMQLLDAGDVLKVLDELGFHMVLHGHKHVPHTYPRVRSDSSVVTVIGAGTVTCPFIDEQAGFGNNFNLITLAAENNDLSVQLFKANQVGEFEPQGDPKAYPLRRVAPLGYSARTVRKIANLSGDGTLSATVIKEGIRVEQPGVKVRSLPLRIVTPVTGAKIVDFQPQSTAATPAYIAADNIIDGEWHLNDPLERGSASIDIAYCYKMTGATAMSKEQFQKMYTSGAVEESTRVVVTHSMETLRIEIAFPTTPRQFNTNPVPRVIRLGEEIPPPKNGFKYDSFTNRCEFEVKNPPLDHTFAIAWSLPDTWVLPQPVVAAQPAQAPASPPPAPRRRPNEEAVPGRRELGIDIDNRANGGATGLSIAVVNHDASNLRNCRVVLSDARSYDSQRSVFRDGSGFGNVVLASEKTVFAGDKTAPTWFIRIAGDHLEAGDSTGQGILRWPRADTAEQEIWLLKISVDCENAAPSTFDVRITWSRRSNVIEGHVMASAGDGH